MDIFQIPEEVFYGNLFPVLNWNDLLRFRRVSKYSKHLTDGYLKNHPQVAPELEINETDRTMKEYLELGIPTTKFFLNNASGMGFFEKQAGPLSTFLTDRGHLITHLRVNQLSIHLYGNEWAFYDGLPNLESLEVKDYGIVAQDSSDKVVEVEELGKQEVKRRDILFPKIFKSLKKLDMNVEDSAEVSNIALKAMMINQFCESLQHAVLPFNSGFTIPENPDSFSLFLNPEIVFNNLQIGVLRSAMGHLGEWIGARHDNHSDKPNLKYYDFKHYYYEDQDCIEARQLEQSASLEFLDLCETCVRHEVKLLNVNAAWFQNIVIHRHNQGAEAVRHDIGNCVVSLVNLHPSLLYIDLPNMTELEIQNTSRSCVVYSTNWPSLKVLRINVNSDLTDEYALPWKLLYLGDRDAMPPAPPCHDLYRFLFSITTFPQLVELSIVFQLQEVQHVPNAEEIVSSCPNLKKVTLVNWLGTNGALCTLWNGLPGLEEISLESCKKLGNHAFFGKDIHAPVFFKLPRLRKLSLKGLDQMPNITDRVFQLVLPHLNLTHLILSSEKPIQNITTAGIRALQNGKFACSIEKFPFKGWSLADCSSEADFIKLGSEFRSASMI